MQDLNEVFLRVQEAKKKLKDIRAQYKDALQNTPGYAELLEEIKAKRDRKKQIEHTIKEHYSKEFIELEDLKIDIDSNTELLSDIALSRLIKGEQVEVNDAHDNQYEPIFSVKFKKIN
ncbi:MAG: hypothetical protein HYY51_00110 [Candidatus Magasanikbacteria bacterium]|nr:hypothetical protein [Candidatus Magasanikbacteria bacterium]